MNIINDIYLKIFDAQSPEGLALEIVLSLAVLVLFRIFAGIVSGNAKFIAQKIFKAKNENMENAIIATIKKPIYIFIIITGVGIAVIMFPFSD